MTKLSFIIPCYRSEDTISAVVEEIQKETKKINIDYEIILIDDCSPDNQMNLFKTMAQDKRIKIISFSKNFGQHSGILAGLRTSEGDCSVILDDDGQCPLDYLKELIQPINEGYDAVFAKYGRQKQSLFKNLCSSINFTVANLLTEKPKDIQMTNFIALSKVAVNEIKKYRGPYPVTSGLIFRAVKKIKNVPMPERKRASGRTTYNIRRLFELWLNTITAFSIKPLRFGSFVGGIFSLAGIVFVISIVIKKAINPSIPIGWTSTISIIMILGGMILFVLGMIGEYVGRIYMSINNTPQYVIRETYNIDINNKASQYMVQDTVNVDKDKKIIPSSPFWT